jgi:hypothetical protein
LGAISRKWGLTTACKGWIRADANNNATVSLGDIGVVTSHWGQTGFVAPEYVAGGTVASSLEYLHEADPSYNPGWNYRLKDYVSWIDSGTFPNDMYINGRQHYINIDHQGWDTNCQVDWVETVPYPVIQDYFQDYLDFNNTPVIISSAGTFASFYTYDNEFGEVSESEMYYGYYDDGGTTCYPWGWSVESAGFIDQAFIGESSTTGARYWNWAVCAHNALDPDCPTW